MPVPSSLTRISLRPPSSSEISMTVAPASIAFSTSSFTTDEGRSTTSPAAIWSATELGRIEITGILTSKLPVLAPWWGRDVLLLLLALHVGFLALRGIEHSFGLLRRHSGNWLWCRSLVLTRRGGWTRSLALATTAASSSAASTSTATALLLPQRQLVIPSRIGIGDCDLEYLLVAIEGAVQGSVGRIFLGATSFDQVVQPEVETRVMANFRIF